jgi:hypothetical protein
MHTPRHTCFQAQILIRRRGECARENYPTSQMLLVSAMGFLPIVLLDYHLLITSLTANHWSSMARVNMALTRVLERRRATVATFGSRKAERLPQVNRRRPYPRKWWTTGSGVLASI